MYMYGNLDTNTRRTIFIRESWLSDKEHEVDVHRL